MPTDQENSVTVESEVCTNSLGMTITVYTVRVDGTAAGEFRDPQFAELFADAVRARKNSSKKP